MAWECRRYREKKQTMINQRSIFTWVGEITGQTIEQVRQRAHLMKGVSILSSTVPRQFVDECHALGLETRYCLHGPAADFDSSGGAAATVNRMRELCDETGMDGVDLDYEHYAPTYKPAYSDFMRRMADSLHGAGLKMDICVNYLHLIQDHGEAAMFQDPRVVNETCDQVRVMCYDMYFAYGRGNKDLVHRGDCYGFGPTATIPWARDAMRFWGQFIPAEKLVMGLPAYGNDYNITTFGPGEQIYFPEKDLPAVPKQEVRLWYEQIPAFHYTDARGHAHIYFGFDGQSTAALLRVAEELDVPTISFWTMASATPAMWAVAETWLRK